MTFANSAEIEILINEFPILNDVNFISINNEEETPFSLLPKKIAVAIYGRVLSGRMFKQSNGVLLSIFPKLNSLLNHSQFDIVIYENLASLDIARKIKSIKNTRLLYCQRIRNARRNDYAQ